MLAGILLPISVLRKKKETVDMIADSLLNTFLCVISLHDFRFFSHVEFLAVSVDEFVL